MPLSQDDKAFIWDIVDAAGDILEFIKSTSYSEFENNKMMKFAVERQLLVIGEASNHISQEAKEELGTIPWQEMIGLRNIIAHEYGEILTERIWNIARKDVNELKKELEKYLE